MEHTITEDEAALYDRQIRLWGLEAQQRMRNASILVAGMSGLSNEVCKNIVLAGVGSITLLDHENVTEQDLGAQFLLRESDLGRNRAEAAAVNARLLNPRVKVIVDHENIIDKPDSYFTNFDIVCLIGSTPEQMVRINNACRGSTSSSNNNINDNSSSSTSTGLYAAAVHGMFGYIFCDLKEHLYREESHTLSAKKNGEEHEAMIVERTQTYDSMVNTLQATWPGLSRRALRRKVSPLFFALQVLWAFQMELDGRLPNVSNKEDMEKVFKLRDDILTKAQIDSTFVDDQLLESLIASSMAEIAPVCAIVGGVLAQDILKALSHKDAPLHNYFLYNGLEGSGLVHHVQKP